jgi:hypothetical protein
MAPTEPESSGSPPEPVDVTLSVRGPEKVLESVFAKKAEPNRLKPEQWLTAAMAIVSIVATAIATQCTQRSNRADEIVSAEWLAERRLETTTLDSLYFRVGEQLRAISDRRNTATGVYDSQSDSALIQRINETNRIDDSWRSELPLWDIRIHRYVDSTAFASWDSAVATVNRYGRCVETEYEAYRKANFAYRARSMCLPDSIAAATSVVGFRNAAVKAYKSATPPFVGR